MDATKGEPKKPAILERYRYPFTSNYAYALYCDGELVYHRTDLARVEDYAKENGYVIKRRKGFDKS